MVLGGSLELIKERLLISNNKKRPCYFRLNVYKQNSNFISFWCQIFALQSWRKWKKQGWLQNKLAPKNNLKECVFVNSALKTLYHITLLQTAFLAILPTGKAFVFELAWVLIWPDTFLVSSLYYKAFRDQLSWMKLMYFLYFCTFVLQKD